MSSKRNNKKGAANQMQQPPKQQQNEYSSSDTESEHCDDSDCDCGLKKVQRPRTYWSVCKRYFLIAIILCILIALNEELTNKSTWLNSTVRFYLDQPTIQEFFVGNVRGMGHIKEEIVECPKDMTLKDFMVNHITDYQPCIFRSLVNDWPAMKKWKVKEYLNDVAGKQMINVAMKRGSNIFAFFQEDIQQGQMAYSEFLEKFDRPGKGKQDEHLFFNEEVLPQGLMNDTKEPKVTQQLLNLEDVTFWQGYGTRTLAHYDDRDDLLCVVSGYQNFTLVSAWERLFVYGGYGGMPINYSPIDFKNPDFREFDNFRFAQKYQLSIEEGDCLYIPAYWWYQVESAPVATIAVQFWYKLSSSWLKLVFDGIEENLI